MAKSSLPYKFIFQRFLHGGLQKPFRTHGLHELRAQPDNFIGTLGTKGPEQSSVTRYPALYPSHCLYKAQGVGGALGRQALHGRPLITFIAKAFPLPWLLTAKTRATAPDPTGSKLSKAPGTGQATTRLLDFGIGCLVLPGSGDLVTTYDWA